MAEMKGKIEIDPVCTKDGTILELVDRLVATSNRAVLAEKDFERVNAEANNVTAQLIAARTEISELKKQLEDKQGTVSYWYQKANVLEKQVEALKETILLKEGKHDTDGA